MRDIAQKYLAEKSTSTGGDFILNSFSTKMLFNTKNTCPKKLPVQEVTAREKVAILKKRLLRRGDCSEQKKLLKKSSSCEEISALKK